MMAKDSGNRSKPVLHVEDLSVTFTSPKGSVQAAKGISLDVKAGEIVGLVGESGSGKSVTAMAIAQLLPTGGQCRVSGEVHIAGRHSNRMSRRQFRNMRGRDVAVIFQDPNAALNPIVKVGRQLVEVVRMRQQVKATDAKAYVCDLLSRFGIRDPERICDSFPFELSGGLRQRVAIALALGCEPQLLIADEPTTALDVVVQKKILSLMKDKVRHYQTGVLLISHDLRVISQLCERAYVMLEGRVVEDGAIADVIHRPRHPYTKALINALPEQSAPKQLLPAIDWRMGSDSSRITDLERP